MAVFSEKLLYIDLIRNICITNKNNGLSNIEIKIFNCNCFGCINVDTNNNISLFFGEDTYSLTELNIDDLLGIYKKLNDYF